jgi:hypothetical protein
VRHKLFIIFGALASTRRGGNGRAGPGLPGPGFQLWAQDLGDAIGGGVMTREPIMTGAGMTAARPKEPFVYFAYSQQTLSAAEAIADVVYACRFQERSVKSRMPMITVRTVTAVIEAGTGMALLALPSVMTSLLFGTPLDSLAAESLARVGGAAIVALAIVCWPARRDVSRPASQGVVVAMLFYNVVVADVLAFVSYVHDLRGILLWPAVAFHTGMAAWCVVTMITELAINP